MIPITLTGPDGKEVKGEIPQSWKEVSTEKGLRFVELFLDGEPTEVEKLSVLLGIEIELLKSVSISSLQDALQLTWWATADQLDQLVKPQHEFTFRKQKFKLDSKDFFDCSFGLYSDMNKLEQEKGMMQSIPYKIAAYCRLEGEEYDWDLALKRGKEFFELPFVTVWNLANFFLLARQVLSSSQSGLEKQSQSLKRLEQEYRNSIKTGVTT